LNDFLQDPQISYFPGMLAVKKFAYEGNNIFVQNKSGQSQGDGQWPGAGKRSRFLPTGAPGPIPDISLPGAYLSLYCFKSDGKANIKIKIFSKNRLEKRTYKGAGYLLR
jgi:hypothetical protein